MMPTKLLLDKEIDDAVNCHWRIVWYLFAGFKIMILCSGHPIWFMNYVFSVKIWFVKNSTRIVKYESQIVKSNPDVCNVCLQNNIKIHFWMQI